MSGIFVSYRRDDAAGWAGRLVADLRKRYGDEHIFHDIAAIRAGEDFGQAIQRALGSCEVVLVLIGPNWLSARNRRGELRLGQFDDPVRLEIQLALRRPDLLVVPVLVGGAAMPTRDDLPDDIDALSVRHAAEVSDARWDFDMEQLVRQLARIQAPAPPRRSRRRMYLVAGVVALAAMALVWYVLRAAKDELARPAAIGTNLTTAADPEQPPVNVPRQQPIEVTKPETKQDSAPAPTRANPAALKPKAARIELDGVWEADHEVEFKGGGRARETFEFETRHGEVFGSNWFQGSQLRSAKYALLDGRIDEDRLKFCIQISRDRECFDGIVERDEIRFISTTYVGDPSLSPKTRKFTVRRQAK